MNNSNQENRVDNQDYENILETYQSLKFIPVISKNDTINVLAEDSY